MGTWLFPAAVVKGVEWRVALGGAPLSAWLAVRVGRYVGFVSFAVVC